MAPTIPRCTERKTSSAELQLIDTLIKAPSLPLESQAYLISNNRLEEGGSVRGRTTGGEQGAFSPTCLNPATLDTEKQKQGQKVRDREL